MLLLNHDSPSSDSGTRLAGKDSCVPGANVKIAIVEGYMARTQQDRKNRQPSRAGSKSNEIASAEPTAVSAQEGPPAEAVPVKVTDARRDAVKGIPPDRISSFEGSYDIESTDGFRPNELSGFGDDTSAGGAFARNVISDGDGVCPAIAPLDSEISGRPLGEASSDLGNRPIIEAEAPTDGLLPDDRPGMQEPARLQFYIDEVSEKQISGWVQSLDVPSRRCEIALQERGRILARTIASGFRADLVSAGVGDGCHAFAIPIPPILLDGNEHLLEILEEDTNSPLTAEPIRWRARGIGGTSGSIAAGARDMRLHDVGPRPVAEAERVLLRTRADTSTLDAFLGKGDHRSMSSPRTKASAPAGTSILFDISDLVYYIGHHPNVTGIQRVQSSIALCLLKNRLLPQSRLTFLSFDHSSGNWVSIPTAFLSSLLEDLFKSESQRRVSFSAEGAKLGLLPGARKFDGFGLLDDGNPSVLCVIGAPWVQRDYFQHVLALKRQFGTRLVVEIHDLIPIYARETCDQDTARVFERFLRRALRHTDHFLAGSENTKRDLVRYASSLGLPAPAVTVVQYGSAFDEFWDVSGHAAESGAKELRERFVLFVSTIEGRKNHHLMLKIWRRMIGAGDDPPHLICVGRLGWKSEPFITELVETNYLNGKIILLQDVSDTDLQRLFQACLFTVFPSMYEGWGLPVAESLATGKICVSSDRASIPEVAGEAGVYIDIDDPEQCYEVIRGLVTDPRARRKLETKIRRDYRPIKWRTVAERIVAGCERAAAVDWTDSYPLPLVPYASEISFGRLERDIQGSFGDDLLLRIGNARKGYFLGAPLDELSFLRGEEARAEGRWAEPEDWGTWLCSTGGGIAVGLPPSESRIHFVFLRLSVNSAISDTPITLVANGETVWRGGIGSRERTVCFPVHRRSADGNGAWSLSISAEVPLTDELERQLLAIDRRAPTIGSTSSPTCCCRVGSSFSEVCEK